MLRDLPSPLSVTDLRKWSMRTLVISETETSYTCLPVSCHEQSASGMTYKLTESLGNKENLKQLKCEVKKRHFLISFFSQ